MAKRRIGARLGSAATAGEGTQNLLCAYLAIAVFAGLAANTLLGAWWLDGAVALGIAGWAVIEGRRAWAGQICACAMPARSVLPAGVSALVGEDLPHLAGGVVDEHVPGGGIGPPQPAAAFSTRPSRTATARMPSISVTLPSVCRTGLPSARPVRALPAARANIAAAVTAVQTMPSTECRGRYPAASTTVDCTSR